MSELYKNIRKQRLLLGLSQEELAQKMGYESRSSINKIEMGKSDIPQSKIQAFADALKTTPAALMGWVIEDTSQPLSSAIPPGFDPLPETEKKPLIGNIACGQPILADENIEEYVDVPKGKHIDFCLVCRGDSMIDAGILDGDIVFIHQQLTVENGEIAAVRIGDSATLKRFYQDGEKVMLLPANSKYAPLTYTGEEINSNDIHIEGKAVGFTHWF